MAKKKTKSPWISVKDRLPKDDENVLIHHEDIAKDGVSPLIGWYESWSEPGNFYSLNNSSWPTTVTHWMPIPKLLDL